MNTNTHNMYTHTHAKYTHPCTYQVVVMIGRILVRPLQRRASMYIHVVNICADLNQPVLNIQNELAWLFILKKTYLQNDTFFLKIFSDYPRPQWATMDSRIQQHTKPYY